MGGAVRAEVANIATRAEERLRRLTHELKHAPSLRLLERIMGQVVDRLLPREIALLRRVLTVPRAFIAFKAREAVKYILLGRGSCNSSATSRYRSRVSPSCVIASACSRPGTFMCSLWYATVANSSLA
jgi:hypothetical protein